jgi:hypothetical protein
VTDSRRILTYLTAEFHVALDAGLTADQLATETLLRRLTEDHMYYCAARFFLVDRTAWVMAHSMAAVPKLLLAAFYDYIRAGTIATLDAGNVGDLSDAEYHAAWLADMQAVSAVLERAAAGQADKAAPTFLLGGAAPTSVDCGVYAHLVSAAAAAEHAALRCPANDFCLADARLAAYAAAMEAAAFPDLGALLVGARAVPLPHDVSCAPRLRTIKAALVGAAAVAGYFAWKALA